MPSGRLQGNWNGFLVGARRRPVNRLPARRGARSRPCPSLIEVSRLESALSSSPPGAGTRNPTAPACRGDCPLQRGRSGCSACERPPGAVRPHRGPRTGRRPSPEGKHGSLSGQSRAVTGANPRFGGRKGLRLRESPALGSALPHGARDSVPCRFPRDLERTVFTPGGRLWSCPRFGMRRGAPGGRWMLRSTGSSRSIFR